MFKTTTTWGCVCREGRLCAHHATIKRITDSGTDLSLRLAAVDYSTIPAQQREAAIIRAELAARRRRIVREG